jgi:predicted nucleic acid-binding protein
MPEKAIVDTSALIALEKINLLDILCKIYSEIILPESVSSEFGKLPLECYSTKKVTSSFVNLLTGTLNLGKGEAEVITLAKETGMKIIIDDLKARKVAETLELNVTGTIGVLLKAENLRFIESAYNKAKELKEKGFYVSDELLDYIFHFRK